MKEEPNSNRQPEHLKWKRISFRALKRYIHWLNNLHRRRSLHVQFVPIELILNSSSSGASHTAINREQQRQHRHRQKWRQEAALKQTFNALLGLLFSSQVNLHFIHIIIPSSQVAPLRAKLRIVGKGIGGTVVCIIVSKRYETDRERVELDKILFSYVYSVPFQSLCHVFFIIRSSYELQFISWNILSSVSLQLFIALRVAVSPWIIRWTNSTICVYLEWATGCDIIVIRCTH